VKMQTGWRIPPTCLLKGVKRFGFLLAISDA
jgi:hypothetical protein